MTGHGAKFGRKKEEAIIALLTHRNVEEAAKSIGISFSTLSRIERGETIDGRTLALRILLARYEDRQ